MSAPDVFLSNNREDQTVAQRFAEGFEAAGMSVWWDVTLRSGENYDAVTEEALKTAKAVVVLWSPRSVVSRWVRAEATLAERNRTLVPARIEPCDLPIMFELTQTADLSHWQGDANNLDWRAFLADVERKVGRGSAEPRPDSAAMTRASEPTTAQSGAGVPQAGVLPFTFRGNDEELAFLAEDLTEDVTRAFAGNDYFKVIAAGTMAAWRRKPHDYRAIGREVDARYLAEGKLQRAGDMIRLTVQLVETETANTVWSHRFAASNAEIADNAEDFAREITSQMADATFRAEARRAIAKPAPHSAWEHVARAIAFSFGMTADGPQSLVEARAAVAAAPNYGLAHAALAGAINTVTGYVGKRLDAELRRELHEHVGKALQLDGDNPAVLQRVWQAHISLGDGESLLRLARRFVELRPHSPLSHRTLAGAYFTLGLTAEAIAAHLDALDCRGDDPERYATYWTMGWCQLLEGQVLEAEISLDHALALAPNDWRALQFKAIAEALLGKEKAALATIRKLRDFAPDVPVDQHIFFMTQNPRLARRSGEHIAILRRLWEATES